MPTCPALGAPGTLFSWARELGLQCPWVGGRSVPPGAGMGGGPGRLRPGRLMGTVLPQERCPSQGPHLRSAAGWCQATLSCGAAPCSVGCLAAPSRCQQHLLRQVYVPALSPAPSGSPWPGACFGTPLHRPTASMLCFQCCLVSAEAALLLLPPRRSFLLPAADFEAQTLCHLWPCPPQGCPSQRDPTCRSPDPPR